MFTESHHHMDRGSWKLDLAEKIAGRCRRSLAITAEKHEAWRTARESSEASGRT